MIEENFKTKTLLLIENVESNFNSFNQRDPSLGRLRKLL